MILVKRWAITILLPNPNNPNTPNSPNHPSNPNTPNPTDHKITRSRQSARSVIRMNLTFVSLAGIQPKCRICHRKLNRGEIVIQVHGPKKPIHPGGDKTRPTLMLPDVYSQHVQCGTSVESDTVVSRRTVKLDKIHFRCTGRYLEFGC